jgi:hypothetical protein
MSKLKRYQVSLWVIVVVLIAFLAGIVTGALAFLVAPVSGANTNTLELDAHTWRGSGTFAENEVYDAAVYVSGFRSDGFSEKAVASPRAARFETSCINPGLAVVRHWFKSASGAYPEENTVTPTDLRDEAGNPIATPGPAWILLREDAKGIGSGFGCQDNVLFGASLVQVRGNFIGILRAEFWVDWRAAFHGGHYHLMAIDEAAVVPGWGTLAIENAGSLVQVGDELGIRYDVGAACSVKADGGTRLGGCGWILSLRNRDSGAAPEGWEDVTPADFAQGTVRLPVRPSWFQLGAHNEYEVKLFNQLNVQDVRIFVTIDDADLAPGAPRIQVSPGPPYRQGDELTLTVSADPNPITLRDIAEYHVVVRQGGRILVDERSASGLIVFTIADEQLDVKIEATSFDGERTGGVSRVLLAVLDADLDNNPPPSNAPAENPGLVLAVAGAILVLVAFAIPMPKSLGILRYVTAMIGLALVGAAFVVGIHLPFLGRVGL